MRNKVLLANVVEYKHKHWNYPKNGEELAWLPYLTKMALCGWELITFKTTTHGREVYFRRQLKTVEVDQPTCTTCAFYLYDENANAMICTGDVPVNMPYVSDFRHTFQPDSDFGCNFHSARRV